MEPLILRGVSHVPARYSLSNEFFESLDIDTTAQWIQERTGIESRRSVLSPEVICQLRFGHISLPQLYANKALPAFWEGAQEAWTQLQHRIDGPRQSPLNPDLVICGTSIPDFDIPAHASVVASHLGLKGYCLDAHSACSSFVTGLGVARGLLTEDTFHQAAFRQAALFHVERYSTRMNFSDRSSSVLFGDGLCASVLERGRHLKGFQVLDLVFASDPSGWEQVQIPVYESFRQNGAAVQKFAITRTCETVLTLLKKHRLATSDIHYFIGHQANLRMLQSSVDKLGFKPGQHLFNVHRYGNQGAVGAPSVLAEHWGQFKHGDLVILAVVGAGLTWAGALLQFQTPL